MNASKVIPENLLACPLILKKIRLLINQKTTNQCPLTGRSSCFVKMNFSKLTDSNQILRNYFVCIHCHL